MRSSKQFTAAICTYNGAATISRVLDGLVKQKGIDSLDWEIIVIDNNSTDNLRQIINKYRSEWSHPFDLVYLFESKQGKSNAIRTAFDNAKGALIGFLDDDNIPSENWVAEAYDFGKVHSLAGAYGSCIYPLYTAEPPDWIDEIEGAFAIKRNKETHKYPPASLFSLLFAPGAGLVIRAKAWSESVPDKLLLEGPSGGSSLGLHEDMEIQWYIYNSGWEVWHNPKMKIRHIIPQERFEHQYLLRFFRELGRSRYKFRMLVYPTWKIPFVISGYVLVDCYKYINLVIKNKIHTSKSFGMKYRIEMRKYLILSPFLHLKEKIFGSRSY